MNDVTKVTSNIAVVVYFYCQKNVINGVHMKKQSLIDFF